MPGEWPVVLTPGEDGWIVAQCPLFDGCISQGRTREEALANIQEAISLCLDEVDEEHTPRPSWEIVQVA